MSKISLRASQLLAKRCLIGTAGWSLPGAEQPHFAGTGSHLERYASQFSAVEINSSFHRPHRPSTYVRWAATVPEEFRFAVKIPKTITHQLRLEDAEAEFEVFLEEAGSLGKKLGCLLVQLPPSLVFSASVARRFFQLVRSLTSTAVVCEPRHASWFEPAADALLVESRVARVAADPPPVPAGSAPGGWSGVRYHRLHGAPRKYYSAYEAAFIVQLAEQLREQPCAAPSNPRWCIFDNTTLGAATRNALDLQTLLETGHADGTAE